MSDETRRPREEIKALVQSVRHYTDLAEKQDNDARQIGSILAALSYLTDLIEKTNERINDLYNYH